MVIIEIKRVEWNESLQCEFEDIVPALVWDPTELYQFLIENVHNPFAFDEDELAETEE